jgi:hypothetical protein
MKTSNNQRVARNTIPAALLALGMAIAGQSAWAGSASDPLQVAEGQAAVTELGDNAKAVTYWSQQPEGAVVVTTVDTVTGADTDAEQHAIVRLTAVLQPGQAQEIAVPLAVGDTQPVLRIERVGDAVSVSKVSQ